MPSPALIIDSGAFSAWKLGKPINFQAYCDFLHKNASWIDECVVLDHIDPDDVETAAERSFDNWQLMRAQGLRPIPVFHARESLKWLDMMLDKGATYIGLSASSLVDYGAVDHWYDIAWNYVVNKGGLPVARFHAFGEGRVASIVRYPWYSVDSTNWAYFAGQSGKAKLPGGINVSWSNAAKSSRSAKHISQLDDGEQALLEEWCIARGLNTSVLTDSAMQRALRFYLEAEYHKDLEWSLRTASDKPKTWIPTGFSVPKPRKQPGLCFQQTKLYLVSTHDPAAWPALAYSEYPQILFSYYYLQSDLACQRLQHFLRNPKEAVATYPGWARFLPLYQG